jgi:ankyrin repeat protein
MYGYQEIVTLLLEYGCDPNGSTEIRPLCSATEYGHTHVAELLLKHNSYPDLCDKNNIPSLLMRILEMYCINYTHFLSVLITF